MIVHNNFYSIDKSTRKDKTEYSIPLHICEYKSICVQLQAQMHPYSSKYLTSFHMFGKKLPIISQNDSPLIRIVQRQIAYLQKFTFKFYLKQKYVTSIISTYIKTMKFSYRTIEKFKFLYKILSFRTKYGVNKFNYYLKNRLQVWRNLIFAFKIKHVLYLI